MHEISVGGSGAYLAALLQLRYAYQLLEIADRLGRCGVALGLNDGVRINGSGGVRFLGTRVRGLTDGDPLKADAEFFGAMGIEPASMIAATLKAWASIAPFTDEVDRRNNPVQRKTHGVFHTALGGRPARVTVMASRTTLGNEDVSFGFELPDMRKLGAYSQDR